MKKFAHLFIVLFAILLVFTGCKTNNESESIVSGEVISNSDCKSLKTSNSVLDISDTLSCINYEFNISSNSLFIKHINSGFNCCPENIYCEVEFINDTIIVKEYGKDAACGCLCLFDVDITIKGLQAKTYIIKFVETYCGNQDKLIFELDLSARASGDFCVTRKNYPWGVSQY